MRDTPHPVNPAEPLRAIQAKPWAFDYFQALRWIESQHPNKPRLGTARKPSDEPVRLGQAPDMSFAPSTLHALVPGTSKSPPRIEVRFFGLFGPNGPMPFHLTEYARERLIHHGDASFARFADLFHHRMLLLFYRAWAQAQPTVSLDRPGDDRFAAYVGSLIGLGTQTLRKRDAAPDHAKLYFSGLLSRQVRNADGLAALLSGYLKRPVRVEQFVGLWLALPPSERTRIGRATGGRHNPAAQLGQGAVLGGMVWDRQHNFRVHIGPLDWSAFETLLPDGAALPALVALVAQYGNDEWGWDLRLSLKPDQVVPCRPGRHGRLGWTSWLGMQDRRKTAEITLEPTAAMRRMQRERSRTSH